ncbi:E3 ubiquitin-protein ligase parkin [Tribolium madens]|uniref:E3 ubiquitin-protein ligase parkin n=1 Tax=Tribolium madens TaxID=41895 RepID=UPI001CF75A15|nr:E3 ubiquitin-protein ligase parkin [Tribolium madens]
MMSFIINVIKDLLHRMLQFLSFSKKTLSNTLSIYIKTNTGNTLSVDLDPTWDIKDVKELVAPQLGLQPGEVKIIFAGKELGDNISIAECDLGQQSTLHAIKITKKSHPPSLDTSVIEESDEGKPLCETLSDLSFSNDSEEAPSEQHKVHFFVYCPTCKSLKKGKLRVRCHFCKSGAFTVHSDPQNWNDVLQPRQITGLCENNPEVCAHILNNQEPTFAEFYFKCSEHTSLGEADEAVPLYLIRPNLKEVPCLACADTNEIVFVFPCKEGHVTCLDCFRQYCTTRLRERQFWQHPEFGYTLACPAGCPDSFIQEIHHFRLLSESQYTQYQRFATEEYVLRSGGVLCPQPGCGMGILAEPECTKITCINGCGYVFCRLCLQGYHIGECEAPEGDSGSPGDCSYNVDPTRAAEARWDEASKVAIKVLTKPCPKCRTPTERDGGCMHMICTRAGCEYHWCWVCQTAWTRECMGSHWFG